MGGIVILFTHWYVTDPILSVLIAILIAFGAWRIVKQTVGILMEGIPKGINDILKTINGVSSIQDMHDVRVWSVTDGKMLCHVM